MTTISIKNLSGEALNYAVAFYNGKQVRRWLDNLYINESEVWNPNENWFQAGVLIESERMGLYPLHNIGYGASIYRHDEHGINKLIAKETGKTPLEAAMRCFVASKSQDGTVDIPNELLHEIRLETFTI